MFQKLSDQLVSTSVKGLCMVYQLLIPEHEAFPRWLKYVNSPCTKGSFEFQSLYLKNLSNLPYTFSQLLKRSLGGLFG
jgi:hypothetical protein